MYESGRGVTFHELPDITLGYESKPNEKQGDIEHAAVDRLASGLDDISKTGAFQSRHRKDIQEIDQSGENHIGAQTRPNQSPDKPNVKEGAEIACYRLMDLSHRHIKPRRDENGNPDKARQGTDRRLLVTFVKGIEPAEFPGKQHN